MRSRIFSSKALIMNINVQVFGRAHLLQIKIVAPEVRSELYALGCGCMYAILQRNVGPTYLL